MTKNNLVQFPKTFTAVVPPTNGVAEMMVKLQITVTASIALKIFALMQDMPPQG